jgi:hypothetical protein
MRINFYTVRGSYVDIEPSDVERIDVYPDGTASVTLKLIGVEAYRIQSKLFEDEPREVKTPDSKKH